MLGGGPLSDALYKRLASLSALSSDTADMPYLCGGFVNIFLFGGSCFVLFFVHFSDFYYF